MAQRDFCAGKDTLRRIDYGLLNGKPQVWEINTNPTIIRPAAARPLPEEQIRLRDPVRQVFFPSLQAAIEAIDRATDPSQTVRIKVAAPEARCRKAAEAAGPSEKDGHLPRTRLLLQSDPLSSTIRVNGIGVGALLLPFRRCRDSL